MCVCTCMCICICMNAIYIYSLHDNAAQTWILVKFAVRDVFMMCLKFPMTQIYSTIFYSCWVRQELHLPYAEGSARLPFCNSVQFLCLHICYFLTWTLVKFACLCDVSFAQSGPLTDGRSNSVHIISWQNGVQKYPSVSKTKKASL